MPGERLRERRGRCAGFHAAFTESSCAFIVQSVCLRNEPDWPYVAKTVKKQSVVRLLVALLFGASAGFATAETMPLNQVKKGMKGYGLTVFEGNKIERFDVEILGVLHNIGPRQNLILGRVDSELVNHSGIIAGMSGSPIYIDGKVIGALAYSWQFAKDPIAGITPIEEMLRIGAHPAPSGNLPGSRASAAQFLDTLVHGKTSARFEEMVRALSRTHSASGALPISVPLSLGNFASETVGRYGRFLEASGFMTVPAGSTGTGLAPAGRNASHFKPGDAIAGVLVDGDFSVAASGTVTYVDGDQVYAFGHPFMDMGEISFPMALSEVVTVMPNVARSFKFANTGATVGTLKQDRNAGILGVVGLTTEMIPVELSVSGVGGNESYKLRIVRHPMLSPLLIAMAADSVVASTQRAAGERTVVLDSEITIDGFPPIRLRDGWAGSQAREAIPSYLAVVSSYLLSNEFRNASITKIKIHLRHDDDLRVAKLIEASVVVPDNGRIRPGDLIQVRTRLKPYRGESFEEIFEVRIPDTQRPGPAYVFVGSGSAVNQLDFSLVPPDPQTLAQVISVVERLRPATDLMVGLYSASDGVVAAGVFLPDLPPSVNAVVNSDSTNASRMPVRFSTPQHARRSLDYVVDGALKIDLDIRPRM